MESIKFMAKFGDEVKEMELTTAVGGGTSWSVYIEKYYCGAFNKMSDGWCFFGNDRGNSMLTEIAQERLLKMILKHLGKQ